MFNVRPVPNTVVVKKSNKPFKGGLKTAVVKANVINPITKKPAVLLDNGSIVDNCQLRPK